jgi:hypothetical protein
VSSSAEQASASVVLLEGQRIVVQLTTEGFSVCIKAFFTTVLATHVFCPQVVNPKSAKIHETIENLLQSVSPLYAKKRQEELFAALSKLS